MRTNLEDNLAYGLRHFATKRPSITAALASTFDIPIKGPEIYLLDPGASTRIVRLPTLAQEGSFLIANIGTTNNLDIYNSASVLQTSLQPGELKYFFSGASRWIWLAGNMNFDDPTGMTEELRQVTAAGAQTISATEAGLVINKAVASATAVALPAVATRAGKPVRFVDWRQNVDAANPVVVTPNGVEKIMNQANWSFEAIGYGGVILFPHTGLGGWTIGG